MMCGKREGSRKLMTRADEEKVVKWLADIRLKIFGAHTQTKNAFDFVKTHLLIDLNTIL